MATEVGREGAALNLAALENALVDNPTGFGFFQAVRLLERLRPNRSPVGEWGDPADEVARFFVNPTIGFPASEIAHIDADDDSPVGVSVNFMGLTGPIGVLPHFYTLMMAESRRSKAPALADFLDLFHHRIVSLFHRAWEKHQFTVRYEKTGTDPLREHLLDLAGLGLARWRDLLPVPDDAIAFYAGLVLLQQRGAVALEQLVGDYFGVPVEVQQFVGSWHPLPMRDQTAIDDEAGDDSGRLGLGAVAGDEIWDQQARVRIRIGPLPREQFDRFLPTGAACRELRGMVRFFGHEQYDVEVQLVLQGDDVPGCVLGASESMNQPLGWSTWIRSTTFKRDADETVLEL
jgi:type VI secretion system protein ImpH